MKNSKIYKIHANEEIEIAKIDLKIKLLFFKNILESKEYEEVGDKYELEFIFSKKNEQKVKKFGWFSRTSDDNKHFDIFDYTFLHIKDSYEPFSEKDKIGHWLKFVIYKIQKDMEMNYGELKRFYLKKDYDNFEL